MANGAGRVKQQPARREDHSVLTLRRGLAILDACSSHSAGLGVNEIARKLALHKSTVSRLGATLQQAGYLERDEQTGKLRIGARVYQLAGSASTSFDPRLVARPILRSLVAACGETAHMAVREGQDVVAIEVADGSRELRLQSRVGHRRPVHASALGKAILAWLPPDELKAMLDSRALVPLTPNSITTLADLLVDLAQVRERGYSVDREEIEEGLRCIGAPVRDQSGRVVAAISVSGPRYRFGEEAMPKLAELVMRSAEQISARLGAPPGPGRAAVLGEAFQSARRAGQSLMMTRSEGPGAI